MLMAFYIIIYRHMYLMKKEKYSSDRGVIFRTSFTKEVKALKS